VTRPRPGVLAALAPLPPLLAAPLCVVLHAPETLALLAATAATVYLAMVVSAQLPPPRLRRQKTLAIAVVALAGCAALYSRAFSGLPAWIGSDSGNHAAILRADNMGAYEGFDSMYLTWSAVEKLLHVNTFWSFCILFYAQIVLLAALPLAVAFNVLRRHEGTRAWTIGAVAATVGALAGTLLVALPLVHYFKVEGFWTQVFALVPLLLLWWLDVTLHRSWQRVILWAAALVVVRYTYGLNLVELLVAFAVIVFLEAPPRLRLPAAAVSLVALAAAWTAHARFATVVKQWGWFVGYNVAHALGAGQLALAALVLAALLGGELLQRALRLPILFAAGSFFITVYHQHYFRPIYYVWKYPFAAICLVALTASVLFAFAGAALAERRWLAAAPLPFFLAAVAMWFSTFAEYHYGYVERLVGRPPHVLRPLADLTAWKHIDTTLATEKKKFGGYLVQLGPLANFMNSALGAADGQRWYFEGQPPKNGPGYCVFWDATQPEPWPEFNRWYRHRPLAQRLDREAQKKCEDYPAPWDASLKRRICHLCR